MRVKVDVHHVVMEEVHDALDEVIQPLAPLIKIPAPGEKKPTKRKKNKRYPAWLIFSKENSSIYPEVRFSCLANK